MSEIKTELTEEEKKKFAAYMDYVIKTIDELIKASETVNFPPGARLFSGIGILITSGSDNFKLLDKAICTLVMNIFLTKKGNKND